MVSSIIGAISNGYTSRQILNYIVKKYPKHANKIEGAIAAGYGADAVLKYISGDKKGGNSDQYLTEFEQTQQIDANNKRNDIGQLIGLAGTAGALGAGLLSLGSRAPAAIAPIRGSQAVHPSAILPPLAQQRPLPQPKARQGLPFKPGGQQPPPTAPNAPNSPVPRQPTGGMPPQQAPHPNSAQGKQLTRQQANVPAVVPPNPDRSVKLVQSLNVADRFDKVLKGGIGVALAAQVLRTMIPKNKLALLDKMEGGFDQIVKDYSQGMLENTRQGTLGKFNEKLKNKSLIDQETERFEKEYGNQPGEAIQGMQNTQQPEMQPQAPVILPQKQAQPNQEQLNQKVSDVSFAQEKPKKLSESPELRRKSFSIPNYRYANEDFSEYHKRKVLYDAVDKGAKALFEGKSFLDFPSTPGAQYSTAKDVLQFMTGLPNIYDPILDDDERQELTNALFESGDMTNPGMTPTPGKQNIHGALLAPNLVWNLLLSVEPKLATMEKPPSVKGYKMAPGKKMGTAELRRFLTHSVYGALSGKTVSPKLGDKINKISKASSSVDVIAKAAQSANAKALQDEIDNIYENDPELLAMLYEEGEEAMKKFKMTPEQIASELEMKIQDTKNAASIKAAKTRKDKKGINEN